MATDRRFRILVTLGALGFGLIPAAAVRAEGPLSAIDWLSESVALPRGATIVAPEPPPRKGRFPSSVPLPDKRSDEPAVTKNAQPAEIVASVLGKPSPDGAGLLSATRTGLPYRLWGLARTEDIARGLSAERLDTLPALQGLMMTLLLAETEPPVDSGGRGVLLLARIDKLLAMGALDQAMALTSVAGRPGPELFRRRFDISLLGGTEDFACEEMAAAPHLAPTIPARVFCLARAGDWQAAALTLDTAIALGQVKEDEQELLQRFLDPGLADGAEPLPAPTTPTPLVWRMYEAIGEPLPTLGLPIAFSHADLRPQAGLKSQIEAAERLARVGAISPNLLLGLYTEQKSAASGGVWDRVDAFQRFDAAMASADPARVTEALAPAWAAMTSVELEAPFAALYGARLSELPLSGDAARLAFRIGLLSSEYHEVATVRARSQPAPDPTESFLIGLATGDLAGRQPFDSMSRAISPAFTSPRITESAQALLDDRRTGEALLQAIDDVGRGVTGDPRGVTEGLSLLRRLGLEDVARRTALELLILERRG